jgi:hypothetical protein
VSQIASIGDLRPCSDDRRDLTASSTSLVDVIGARQRHSHPSLSAHFGLAEQAQRGIRLDKSRL